MAEISAKSANTKYYSLFGGKLVESSREARDGFVQKSVTNTNGTFTKWVREVGALAGRIKEIRHEKKEHEGKKLSNLIILMDDIGDRMQVTLSLDSNAAYSFIKVAANTDLSREIELSFGGKDRVGTFIKYRGTSDNIKWKWSKEHPGDLPQAEKRMDKGEEKWDWSKQENFLYDYLMKVIIPSLAMPAKAAETIVSGTGLPF